MNNMGSTYEKRYPFPAKFIFNQLEAQDAISAGGMAGDLNWRQIVSQKKKNDKLAIE